MINYPNGKKYNNNHNNTSASNRGMALEDDINATNADLTDEVARLKEENGRLYRDRVRTVTEAVEEKVEETLTAEQEAEELLEAINY